MEMLEVRPKDDNKVAQILSLTGVIAVLSFVIKGILSVFQSDQVDSELTNSPKVSWLGPDSLPKVLLRWTPESIS